MLTAIFCLSKLFYRRAQTWTIVVTAMLAGNSLVDCLDLPVATQGLDEWVKIFAQAASYGGKSKEETLQTAKKMQSITMSSFQEHVSQTINLLTA